MKGTKAWVSYAAGCCSIDDFCNALMTHRSILFLEFEDSSREETVQTYKEWLRVEGKLDQISNILPKLSNKLSLLRKLFI
jgi:hypothetical protein